MTKRLLQSGLIAALLFLFAFADKNSVNLNANLSENSQNSVNFSPNSQINSQNSVNSFENSQNSAPNSQENSQNFILINDGILKPEAVAKLNEIGAELKSKSGISLALAVSNESLDELMGLKNSLQSPYLLIIMSLNDKKIKVQSEGIYEADKAGKISEKVLEKSVYPLLGQKNPNYAAALFNGYADFADIIAANAKITLVSSVGNANRQTMNIIKIIFYGAICVALLYFFSRRAKRKRV